MDCITDSSFYIPFDTFLHRLSSVAKGGDSLLTFRLGLFDLLSMAKARSSG